MSSSEKIHRGRKRTRTEKSWNRNIAKQSRNQVHILHHIINVYYNCRGSYKQLMKLTMIYYILDFMYNVKTIATKAFVFVAPLRFPRNPFLFPLPPELSFVVRYRATQTQRKQTATKATVVNKKI